MKKGIIKDLKEFTAGAPQSDDITLLLMLVK
jgi:serine phosphatase RsbU (regulator of sigma subunit)